MMSALESFSKATFDISFCSAVEISLNSTVLPTEGREVEYEKVDDEVGKFEIWTCYVVLEGDKSDPKTHFPICSYVKK